LADLGEERAARELEPPHRPGVRAREVGEPGDRERAHRLRRVAEPDVAVLERIADRDPVVARALVALDQGHERGAVGGVDQRVAGDERRRAREPLAPRRARGGGVSHEDEVGRHASREVDRKRMGRHPDLPGVRRAGREPCAAARGEAVPGGIRLRLEPCAERRDDAAVA
jgi:hypothetical protein